MTDHVCTRECWDHIIRYGTRLTHFCTSEAARIAAHESPAGMTDGGWSFSGEKGWLLDPSQQPRVRQLHIDTMARIDELQGKLPTCALCGQRALQLDSFGLCSKVSESHKDWRNDARATPSVRFR